MPTLEAIARGVHTIIYPSQNDETPIPFGVFLSAAKTHYAYRVWELNRADVRSEGENNIPTSLLSVGSLVVKEKIADISKLQAMTSLPGNTWIQSLGGFECGDCSYDIMDMNKWKLLCDDKSRKEGDKAVIVVGNTLRFVEGIFDDNEEVEIVYANMGQGVDGKTDIDQALGALVRRDLLNDFSKRNPLDKTNDSNGDK